MFKIIWEILTIVILIMVLMLLIIPLFEDRWGRKNKDDFLLKPYHLEINKTSITQETVSCNQCYCLIDKKNAQRVVNVAFGDRYYCGAHRKPYNRIVPINLWGDEKIQYWGEIQMNEDGTPVGYKKIQKTRHA